jgi:hypothetical protein
MEFKDKKGATVLTRSVVPEKPEEALNGAIRLLLGPAGLLDIEYRV